MLYISRDGEQALVIRIKSKTVMKVKGENVLQHDPGLKFRFRRVAIPYRTNLLPGKRGKEEQWGELDTKAEAARLKIPESEVIRILSQHPLLGVEFAPLGPVDEVTSTLPEELYISRSGTKGYFCKLCNKQLKDLRGLALHKKGSVHVACLMEAEKEAQREAKGA